MVCGRLDFQSNGRLFFLFGFEVGGESRAFAEEVFLAFGHPDALAVFAHQVEAKLVDEHFRVFEPHFPGGLRDGIEESCAERAFEGGFVKTFCFLTEFDALDHFSHGEVL